MQVERAPIKPRPSPVSFEESVPRHWFAGVAVATHIANGANLLFPAGERFFIRSVRRYMDRIADDPALVEQVKGFFGQEGRHAGAHEKFFEVMEDQGYEIRRFLEIYQRIAFEWLEPNVPAELRLSVTVALEHFTATMAENALREGILELADPRLKTLLLWHACEEIEHKAVAFDVLAKVNPSYPLRMAGLAVATVFLAGFWIVATGMLLSQDRKLGASERPFEQWKKLPQRQSIAKRVFARGIRSYMRRGFHPWQNDNGELAQGWLSGAGIA